MTTKEFNTINKLYHFTNFESALKIIESKTLLFNLLKRMNDINELYRPLVFQSGLLSDESEKMMTFVIYSHQQISLTRDHRGKKGFDIPAMWGHYADKGRGVCLIFDKNKLLKTLPRGHKKGYVKYIPADNFDSTVIINENSIYNNQFSAVEYKEYFFKKTNDWNYEQEFRVLVKSDSSKRIPLDYKDSLIGAIIHNADDIKEGDTVRNSVNYRILKKHLSNVFVYASFFNERNLSDSEGNQIWSNIESGRYSV